MKKFFDETEKFKGLASPFVRAYYSFSRGLELESPAGQIFGATYNKRFFLRGLDFYNYIVKSHRAIFQIHNQLIISPWSETASVDKD